MCDRSRTDYSLEDIVKMDIIKVTFLLKKKYEIHHKTLSCNGNP